MPAALFVVLHVSAYGTSVLPDILRRHGPLPAMHPTDGQAVEPGRIYVAPPNHHLVLYQGRIRLTRGPHENGVRPAVDTLFRSAARAYGPRVVGVVLSGMLDDGTAGAQAIKMRSGKVIVQDPKEAMFEGMPRHAMEHVQTDFVLPVAQIAPTLVHLSQTPVEEAKMTPVPPDMNTEVDMAMFEMGAMEGNHGAAEQLHVRCPFMCDARRQGDWNDNVFATLSLFVIDPSTGEGMLSLAGSEPALLRRAKGEIEALEPRGMLLGIEPAQEYGQTEVMMLPGDTLLLATDGITEARRGRDFLGVDGLSDLLRQAAPKGAAQAVGKAVLQGVQSFVAAPEGSGSLSDDACVLIVQRSAL